MKLIEVLAIAIRLCGILLFVYGLRHFPIWLLQAEQMKDPAMALPGISIHYYYYSAFFIFLLSLLMILFPVSLAKLLASKTSANAPLLEEKGEAIQVAGITLIGVYILTWAIPDFVLNALTFFEIKMSTPGNSIGLRSVIISEVVTIVEIGIQSSGDS